MTIRATITALVLLLLLAAPVAAEEPTPTPLPNADPVCEFGTLTPGGPFADPVVTAPGDAPPPLLCLDAGGVLPDTAMSR